MVQQELIDHITTKIQEGEKRAKIKEDLLVEGWPEGDIDVAYSHIHREALQQIPLIAYVTRKVHQIEARTATMHHTTVAGILVGCGLLLVALAVGLYFLLDPLNVKAEERDRQREVALTEVPRALGLYYQRNQKYPEKLQELIPTYLAALPDDNRNNATYGYQLLESGDFEFCISFEVKPVTCVQSDTFASKPTTTPIPPTVPPASPSATVIDGDAPVAASQSSGDR